MVKSPGLWGPKRSVTLGLTTTLTAGPAYAKMKVVVKWRDYKCIYMYIQSLVEIMLYDVIVSIFRACRSFRPIQMGRKQPCVQCLPHPLNDVIVSVTYVCRVSMGKDFRLELNYPSGQEVYLTPGEVSGNVVVVTDKPKSYNAISITLKGCADVYFSIGKTGYRSHEDYINDVIVLWNQEQIPNRVLNPGQYVLPFRFVLRRGLPRSFAGPHGYIRYTVEAKLLKGLLHINKKVSVFIQVVNRVNINVPALMSPARFEKERTICCLCCASPSISLTVNVPRIGFCIGEGIPLTASVDNGSGRIITLRATVYKVVTFHAQGRTRISSNRLSSFQSPPVQGHTTFSGHQLNS